jgi:hypothetical protein
MDYFLLLIFGHFPFSFNLMPPRPSETSSKLLAHGTRMSSSMYNKVFFLDFLPPDFWSLAFFFRSCAAFEIVDAAGSWVPHASLYEQ